MDRDLFIRDMKLVELKYPGMQLIESSDALFLKGALFIPDNSGEIVAQYDIELQYRVGYPACFPFVWETSNAFPHTPDWHCYGDTGSCCLKPGIEEALWCIEGFDIIRFMNEVVISYFANQYHRSVHGFYLYGEYSHGNKGILESYEQLLGLKGAIKVLPVLRNIITTNHVYRQSNCPICGNEKVYRCHLQLVRKLLKIRTQLNEDYQKLLQGT